MVDLWFVFLAGLLGSAHCVGMCGGFVLALAHGDAARRWPRQAAYHAGRIGTYTLLGALAGTLGYALFLMRGFQVGLSIGLGTVLVVAGLSLCGVLQKLVPLDRLPIPAALTRLVTWLVQRPGAGPAFGLGLANGLLPCGLVLAVLVPAAAAGSAPGGALRMLAFGLGTVPALLVTAAFGLRVKPTHRLRAQRLAGVVLAVLGFVTIARATPLAEAAHHLVPGHTAHAWQADDPLCRLPR